eukprot:CAMPEP_0114254000 /NCGR_PEP_ID=MMETSP0058-20121206/16728_1 /TAXON_ID=36894 /ORGANISM="Pyramimonas parkeae, CCMP726" /LENGTH=208 /DNA_ID=CAMNT_0001368155 /DNA_START=115 /DNA_END=741 /DNA_ORIENTATION=+
MTMHGSGSATIFAQKKLSVLNPSSLDPLEVRAVFQKLQDKQMKIQKGRLRELLTAVNQGRSPLPVEIQEMDEALFGKDEFTLEQFMDAIAAQAGKDVRSISPTKNNSSSKLRLDIKKHHHNAAEGFCEPIVESQNIGSHTCKLSEPKIVSPTKHHHGSSELSSYIDCVEKHQKGRSVRAELSTYGQARLASQASRTQLNPTGPQHPVF